VARTKILYTTPTYFEKTSKMEEGADGGDVVQDPSPDHNEQQEGTYVRDDGKTVRKVNEIFDRQLCFRRE
jgi:hypothetical protein